MQACIAHACAELDQAWRSVEEGTRWRKMKEWMRRTEIEAQKICCLPIGSKTVSWHDAQKDKNVQTDQMRPAMPYAAMSASSA
jgi:hypothetical protein